jgi:hypothetical protein
MNAPIQIDTKVITKMSCILKKVKIQFFTKKNMLLNFFYFHTDLFLN